MRTQVNELMPFAGLTVGQVREMFEELLATDSKSGPAMPEVIGIEEVSQITGYSVKTIYTLVNKRRIPFHKPPGARKLFFVTTEIYDWMKTNRTETNDEFVRNHRQCKIRRPSNKRKMLQECSQSLKDARLWMSFMGTIMEYQEVTIKIFENQIVQNELHIKSLTQNKKT